MAWIKVSRILPSSSRSRGARGCTKAPDPVRVLGPDMVEPAPPVRCDQDVEPAAIVGADRAADEPVAFHPVEQPGQAAPLLPKA